MRDWLIIDREKENDPSLRKFVQANPVLDTTMRTHLANYLNLGERSVRKWIQVYHESKSEWLENHLFKGLLC